jgi:hypothetical protein
MDSTSRTDQLVGQHVHVGGAVYQRTSERALQSFVALSHHPARGNEPTHDAAGACDAVATRRGEPGGPGAGVVRARAAQLLVRKLKIQPARRSIRRLVATVFIHMARAGHILYGYMINICPWLLRSRAYRTKLTGGEGSLVPRATRGARATPRPGRAGDITAPSESTLPFNAPE